MSKKIEYDGEDRKSVAGATLRIVAQFALASTEDWYDLVESGTAEQCEAKVVEYADAAQQSTLDWGSKNAIVMEVLGRNYLADDFMRMQRGAQAVAFEPGGPRTDVCNNCGAPRGV